MRRELREKGRLAPAPKEKQAQRVAERQAEEEAVSARVAEAREEVAHHAAPTKKARSQRRDFTVLLLLGLTAIAAIIFYLATRAPSADDAGSKPAAGTAHTSDKGSPPR
jgi:hypothetical protein